MPRQQSDPQKSEFVDQSVEGFSRGASSVLIEAMLMAL